MNLRHGVGRRVAVEPVGALLRPALSRLDGFSYDEYRWEPWQAVERHGRTEAPRAAGPSTIPTSNPLLHRSRPSPGGCCTSPTATRSTGSTHSVPGDGNTPTLCLTATPPAPSPTWRRANAPSRSRWPTSMTNNWTSCGRHRGGERWPTGQILAVLLDEQVHHGAEIALLRDLYRAQP